MAVNPVLEHEIGGWVLVLLSKSYKQIHDIHFLSHDDQYWQDYGCPSEQMYRLCFTDGSAMIAFSTLNDLNVFFPYHGKNAKAIEVLYGKQKDDEVR